MAGKLLDIDDVPAWLARERVADNIATQFQLTNIRGETPVIVYRINDRMSGNILTMCSSQEEVSRYIARHPDIWGAVYAHALDNEDEGRVTAVNNTPLSY